MKSKFHITLTTKRLGEFNGCVCMGMPVIFGSNLAKVTAMDENGVITLTFVKKYLGIIKIPYEMIDKLKFVDNFPWIEPIMGEKDGIFRFGLDTEDTEDMDY